MQHVLRETTNRGLCDLVFPSRTSECGGEGDCVKEEGGGEGKSERERAGSATMPQSSTLRLILKLSTQSLWLQRVQLCSSSTDRIQCT